MGTHPALLCWINECISHLMKIKSPNCYLQVSFRGNWCREHVGIGGGAGEDRPCGCKTHTPGYTALYLLTHLQTESASESGGSGFGKHGPSYRECLEEGQGRGRQPRLLIFPWPPGDSKPQRQWGWHRFREVKGAQGHLRPRAAGGQQNSNAPAARDWAAASASSIYLSTRTGVEWGLPGS